MDHYDTCLLLLELLVLVVHLEMVMMYVEVLMNPNNSLNHMVNYSLVMIVM
jgi:hypothetical protein